MTKRYLAGSGIVLLLCTQAAEAQRVLDRVNPGTVENKALPPAAATAAAPPPVTVASPRAVVSPGAPVTVGAIALVGLEDLKPSAFAGIFETYVGRTLSPGALEGLADAIVVRARALGYPFASAWIEPQTLAAGLLRVRIDEGRVDEVRLIGDDNAAVRRALAPLVGSGPVKLSDLERRLLIAGDLDGIWVKRTRFVREGERGILLVDVGRDRQSLRATLANDGSKPIGPVQLQLDGRLSQILSADDSLSATLIATPLQPDEFVYGRLRYAKRVTASGTEVSIGGSYSTSHPGSYLDRFDISGESWSVTADVLQPLIRSRKLSLWGEGSFTVRDVAQARQDLTLRDDRMSVARAGVYGFTDIAGGRLRINATVSQGLDLFGATERGDPLASRRDADATFTSASLFADWTAPVAGPTSVRFAVASQVASQPLLVSEEVGLGGGSFLRAYDYSERMGDEGFMGSAEFRVGLGDRIGFVLKPELYTFVDGGRVINLDGGFGGGTLYSSGGGVRASLTRTMLAGAEVAVPLSGIRYDSGNADPVFNFRLTKTF